MAEYIRRYDAMEICEQYSKHCFDTNDARGQDVADRIEDDIVEISTANVVSREVFEQIKWERDMALRTLEEHGIGLGQKADMIEVTRCKDCQYSYWEKESETSSAFKCGNPNGLFDEIDFNDFCSYAFDRIRKEGTTNDN